MDKCASFESATETERAVVNLDTCPQCDYSLAGHPLDGRCPECGSTYDKRISVWRSGVQLVAMKGAELPMRCIKCDSDESVQAKQKTLVWHGAMLYILFIFYFVPYFIARRFVASRGVIQFGLCRKHVKFYRYVLAIVSFLLLGSIASFTLAFEFGIMWLLLLGGSLIIAALVLWTCVGQTIAATRITDRFIWFRGSGEKYLERFPLWPY